MEMRQYVVGLLKDYNRMKQEIQFLQFELERASVKEDGELIEAMTFSSSCGQRMRGSNVSDQTPAIALNYDKAHAQMLHDLSAQLQELKATVSRLDFYIDQLEAHHASLLRDYYFECYSWRELQDIRGVTSKTLMKHRDDAIRALSMKYESIRRIGLI